MHKENYDIKDYAKSKGVYLWQVAEQYGLHESNFCRLMRHPLNDKNRTRIKKIIDDLAKEKE